MNNLYKIWVVILSVILTGLLFGNAGRAVDKIQESRIAETAREMVVSGDWIIPHYNGELRLQKPPLPYWLTAVSYKVFGVNEGAVRIPSTVCAVLLAMLVFVWAKQEADVNMATNITLVLMTSFIGLRYFRSGEADTTLLFFVSMACYAGYNLVQSITKNAVANRKFVLLFMAALGLGFLTKGPAAIAIPLVTVLLFAYSQYDIKQSLLTIKALVTPLGIIIFIVAAFAWYIWILTTMPDAAVHFLGKQVDATFVSGTHQQPIYWYLQHAIDFFAPWSLLLIPAGIWCYQHRPLPKIIHFSVIWLAVVFFLLTFTVNKQTQYALLFAPPIAMVIGYYVQPTQIKTTANAKFYQFNRVVFWLLCIAVIAAVTVAARKHALAGINPVCWILMLAIPLLAKKLLKLTTLTTPFLLAAVLATMGYLFAEQYLAKEDNKSDIKNLMQTASSKSALYQAKPGDGAVSFYASRPIKAIDEKQLVEQLKTEPQLWLISKDKPELQNVQLAEDHTEGKWTLWKISQ